jgi:hypothetical protein
MKTRFVFLLANVMAIIWIGWLVAQSLMPHPVHIELLSSPYPMIIGQNDLTIVISDANGKRIENANVQLTTQLQHPGAPEIVYYPNRNSNGEYGFAVTWSMSSAAIITVRAELLDASRTVREVFPAYVYLRRPVNADSQSGYRSQREIDHDVLSNADEEYWIVIPQGTSEMGNMGSFSEDIVPDEIRLDLNGQHTLVIRNDDFVDHNIGPFYIRAGETIRQQFTEAGIFEGACSVNHTELIKIIVEG